MDVSVLKGQRLTSIQLLKGSHRLTFDGGSILELFALPDIYSDGHWEDPSAPRYLLSLVNFPGAKAQGATISDLSILTIRFGRKALRVSLSRTDHGDLKCVAFLMPNGDEQTGVILG